MKRIKSLVALLVLCVRAVEFVFGDRADQSLDLVAFRYLHVLQTHGSVDANLALLGTSQQHRRVLAELDHGLGVLMSLPAMSLSKWQTTGMRGSIFRSQISILPSLATLANTDEVLGDQLISLTCCFSDSI